MAASGSRHDDWFDVRLTALDVQLQEIDSAVRRHRESEDRLRALELEVQRFLEQGHRLLADARSAAAADQARRIHEWQVTESRLFEAATRRLQDFQQRIGHEWEALRQLHEAPIRRLEQRAWAAQEMISRAEGRLEGLDQAARGELTAAAREVRDALGDLRGAVPAPGALALRSEILPAPVPGRSSAPRRTWTDLAMAGGLVGLLAYVAFMQWRFDAALERAENRAAAAEQQAGAMMQAAERSAAATRDAATRVGAEALAAAARAERFATLLAAADLRRSPLLGQGAAPAASGQALWSRATGTVALAAGAIAPPPAGRVYQVWLTTSRGPISLGFVSPDVQGRLAASYELPPDLTGVVQGLLVTVEERGGGAAPSSEALLASSY